MAENVTFKVTDRRDGGAYVLRLHRPGYHTLDELDSERAWIRALDEAGVEVPDARAARDGRDYVPVTIAATGERRFAGMVRWTEGEPALRRAGRNRRQRMVESYFAQLGAIMRRDAQPGERLAVAAAFTRHALDADGLMGDAPHLGTFLGARSLSAAERGLLLDHGHGCTRGWQRLGKDASGYSLIHADMHPGNILVDGERLTVIDFDDAGFGWHQYDIAVVLSYWQSKANAAAIERAFLDGYRTARQLPDDALTWIPMFRLIRGMAIDRLVPSTTRTRAPAAFAERKAWVLEQCAALRRGNP